MKDRKVLTVIGSFIFLFLLFCTNPVLAKRLTPSPVEDAVFNQIRYSVTSTIEEMGYVKAWDVQNNKLLWNKKIYEITYDNSLERDVQDAYITNLRVEDNKLLVKNEGGNVYKVDLKTGNVISQTSSSENIQLTQIALKLLVLILLIIIIGLILFKRKNKSK